MCRGRREVEAESVALPLVTKAHGLDSGRYTFGFVAGSADRALRSAPEGTSLSIRATSRCSSFTKPQPDRGAHRQRHYAKPELCAHRGSADNRESIACASRNWRLWACEGKERSSNPVSSRKS